MSSIPSLSFLLDEKTSLANDFAVVRLKTKEGTLLQEYFGRGIYFFTVLNKFQKIAAGENYSHYSFILIQKQKGCNCNDFGGRWYAASVSPTCQIHVW